MPRDVPLSNGNLLVNFDAAGPSQRGPRRAGPPLHQLAAFVSPLTWSHAAYVTAILEYAEKRSSLNPCPECRRPMGIRRP